MRKISLLMVSSVLLATQVSNPLLGAGTALAEASAETKVQYEIRIDTNAANTNGVVVIDNNQTKPDYEAEVMTKIRAAQADAARKAEEAAKAEAEKAAAELTSVVAVQAAAVALPTGSHTDWMAAAGIAESDYGYVDYIINCESGWNATVWNGSGSGAYGLGQALPASKMASYGDDYMSNPITQLKWANAYAVDRYGSWANAYNFWVNAHVW